MGKGLADRITENSTERARVQGLIDASAVDVVDATTLKIGGTAVTSTAAELNILDGVTATATEFNRANDVSGRLVAAGATLSVTEALHDGKTILLDTAAGSICDLSSATGSGAIYRFVISVIATSNSHVVRVAASTDDMMVGSLVNSDTDTADATIAFAAVTADAFDTITLNRSTSGSTTIGEYIEVQDILSGVWSVRGWYAGTGTVITPFSAAITS